MTAFLLTTLLIASSLVAAASAGSFPGSNGKIAFAASGEIAVINPDGTGRVELTTTAVGGESSPAWNATGRKLVFGEGHSFSTMNANGSNRQPLVAHDTFAGNPTWSADSTVIAFDGFIGTMEGSRIFVVSAAGGTATELSGLDAKDPAFSPDGTRIAFEHRDGNDIGLMNANGSGAVTITSGASGNNGDFDPSWSPDGTKIALTRARQIWSMNADGSGATQLTTGADASYPTWSPDGTRIAFQRDDDIWVMDADGSDAVNITSTANIDESEPDWGRAATSSANAATRLVSVDTLFESRFAGSAADGSRVFFETAEALVAEDTDARGDVYERSGGDTVLVSTGPGAEDSVCASKFAGASDDGSRVFFETEERLVAEDIDFGADVYERVAGSTVLVTNQPSDSSGADYCFPDNDFAGVSPDGSHVFFESDAGQGFGGCSLCTSVVYERFGEQTRLVSTGPLGDSSYARFAGASEDGSRVFFSTEDRLVVEDTDADNDIYQRAAAETTLLSGSATGGNAALPAVFKGASADGSRVFFQTSEVLASGDRDGGSLDVYQRAGNEIRLLSTGPSAANGAFDSRFAGASEDGSRVFFETKAKLVDADNDASNDIYQRFGRSTKLLSTGPSGGNRAFDASFAGASADGSRVFFTTLETLEATSRASRRDSKSDIYERTGSVTKLVSTGPAGGSGPFHALFTGASEDGSRIFFETEETLVPTDTDNQRDVYERSQRISRGRVRWITRLVSTGPAGGNGPRPSSFSGVDGALVFFVTPEALVVEDTDARTDVYEHALP